ncbi:hypothetical protein [Kitasatospora sp. MAA19]|uniref:hypothetical protein n=1 Tax=Kitasatospora sp. MAA19 TaxID=3035090 RepID=UPI0024760ADD|nr:hypothetical protein [Kitasatospora sp. MAA19]
MVVGGVIPPQDFDALYEADAAARGLAGALRLLQAPDAAWTPPVLTCSGRDGAGLDVLWERLQQHRKVLDATGALAAKRREQQVEWTWTMVHDQLYARLHEHPDVRRLAPELERQVREGSLPAGLAAQQILDGFFGDS